MLPLLSSPQEALLTPNRAMHSMRLTMTTLTMTTRATVTMRRMAQVLFPTMS
ncbi:hypothetical protein APY04_1690 [Hyphomicrobium sulfonivorans]|uniref:Uncharacterized protein n=1 Tax=Hyphomicrobium sulfonivorans TaxID=121290 RepID=A0A109BI59_HYPSL|nr:hypothetical protein APY04_1690 [Hyphomicrobium sulfonivorans]